MKPFEEQTYYELLEVAPNASAEEIRAAYDRLSKLYGDDNVALYGLADPVEAKKLRERLLEAMEILTDEDLRDEYDRSIGLPPRPRPVQPAGVPDETERMPEQLAMGDILAGAEAVHSTVPRVAVSYIPHLPRPEVFVASSAEPARPETTPTPPPAEAVRARPSRTPETAVAQPIALPEPPPRMDEPPPPPRPSPQPRPNGARAVEAELAPEIAQETAIGIAESALAQVSMRVRERPPPLERPRPLEIPPDAEFNGELIRKARESRGVSLAQLAERTRIGTRHLENIEADRYDELPATVYLRGILMSIAKELGLDALRVSKSYLALVGKRKQ